MPHRVLNLQQAAEYLHLQVSDLEQLVRQQDVPFEVLGRHTIFRVRDIDAWASRRILNMPEKKLSDFHKVTRKQYDLSHESAIITELTQADFVHSGVSARTKPSVLREMSRLAGQTGLVYDPASLLESLEEREKLCSTGLSDGVALLHPRNHEPYMFEESFIVLGRTEHPLPFGALDGQPTDIYFLICCEDDHIHLHVLARLCMMCRKTHFLADVRDAVDASGMYQALCAGEAEVIRKS